MNEPVARYPFFGTGNYSTKFPRAATYLVLFNDGQSDVTFATDTFTHTLKPGDVFDERLDPFSTLQVTSNGGVFRGYCRVGGG